LKHLPKRAFSLFANVFNAVLRTHHFPKTWKQARVILKPGRIQDCPLPIGPLVSWTRLVNYLKRSY
jgi:hypothetical protein